MIEKWSRRCLALTAFLALLSTVPSQGQRNFDDVQIEATKVVDGIYMLAGAGGNLGLSVGEDGPFLIDDQFAPLTDKIRAAVAKLDDRTIRFVLNTHWHGDHTGGNENLGKSGTVVVAHENVRRRMSVENINEFFERTTPPSAPGALPVVTFNDTVTFHLNGEEIHAFHLPAAHTDGDSVIHFRGANVVHVGDLHFNGIYPFIDIWSGGSVAGTIAAVEEVLKRIDDQTKVIPGHGSLSNKAELTAYVEMLRAIHDNVAKLVKGGKSLEDVLAAKPSAAFDEEWGDGFMPPDRFVTIVYKSIAGH